LHYAVKMVKRKASTDIHPPDVIGPDFIQMLRGKMFGKDVALLMCGESHNEAPDVTRPDGVVYPKMGWVQITDYGGGVWSPKDAVKCKKQVDLASALTWATDVIDEEELDADETHLVWEGPKDGKGTAHVYDGDADRSVKKRFGPDALVFEWNDLDAEIRDFKQRIFPSPDVEVQETAEFMAKRKKSLLRQGVELFDDWLLRQVRTARKHAASVKNKKDAMEIHLVIESSVPADEVELHQEPSRPNWPPPAPKCIRALEEDSDSSGDGEDDDPQDYMEYLLLRAETELSSRAIHKVDPRDLGDRDSTCSDWRTLVPKGFDMAATYPCPEEAKLQTAGMPKVMEAEDRRVLERDASGVHRDANGAVVTDLDEDDVIRHSDGTLHDIVDWGSVDPRDCDLAAWKEHKPRRGEFGITLPSFEGFFGQPSELMYYVPHMHACFAPLLARVIKSPEAMNKFFTALFFGGTIPEALAVLDLSPEALPYTWVRSPIRLKGQRIKRRNDKDSVIEFPYFPIGAYLKAKGTNPPRTWLSDLFARCAARGGDAERLAKAARTWALDGIAHMAKDPKGHDTPEHGGDWFAAYLRAVHRDMYDDLDTSDPAALLTARHVASLSKGRGKKYNLGKIGLPSAAASFEAIIEGFTPDAVVNPRASVLAKIALDIWVLSLVDYATVLRTVEAVVTSPCDRVVVVVYLGSQHTSAIVKFWRKHGFSDRGLPKRGLVGKLAWEQYDSLWLSFPSCLCDLTELFTIP